MKSLNPELVGVLQQTVGDYRLDSAALSLLVNLVKRCTLPGESDELVNRFELFGIEVSRYPIPKLFGKFYPFFL
jgi:hypothetical protein